MTSFFSNQDNERTIFRNRTVYLVERNPLSFLKEMFYPEKVRSNLAQVSHYQKSGVVKITIIVMKSIFILCFFLKQNFVIEGQGNQSYLKMCFVIVRKVS